MNNIGGGNSTKNTSKGGTDIAILSQTVSLILENVSEEKACKVLITDWGTAKCTDASLVRFGSALTASTLVQPKPGDVSLLVAVLLGAVLDGESGGDQIDKGEFGSAGSSLGSGGGSWSSGGGGLVGSGGVCQCDADDCAPTPGLARLAVQLLSVHGPSVFRATWGASSPTASATATTAPALRNSNNNYNHSNNYNRHRLFWIDFRRLWSLSLRRRCLHSLALLTFMVALLRADLTKAIEYNNIRKSMLFEFLNHTNFSAFLRNPDYAILDCITEMACFDRGLDGLFGQAALQIGFDLCNLFVFFCREFPSFNTDRIGFDTFSESIWQRLSSESCRDRVFFYRGIIIPEFRTVLLHTDLLEASSDWIPNSINFDYNPRTTFVTQDRILFSCFHVVPVGADAAALTIAAGDGNVETATISYLEKIVALLSILHILLVDSKDNGEADKDTKEAAVSLLEEKVCTWVGGNDVLSR
ncbi:hypothetical protein HK100_001661, partial [Physocladia obscura]